MLVYFLSLFILVGANAKGFMPASFHAEFEESLISLATGKEKKSQGKIDYQFPGHIRFEVVNPNPTLFVSNPKKSWYYTPPFVEGEPGQVTIHQSQRLPLTKVLDSVRNGLENSQLFTTRYEKQDVVLDFKGKTQKDLSLKQVIFHGTKEAKLIQKLGEFESLMIIYTDGRKVRLKFSELKEDVTFPTGHFEFTPPPKTKITNG